MRGKSRNLLILVLAGTLWNHTASAQTTSVTVGVGGMFPENTAFNGVPINALQSGYGVMIESSGSATGQFCAILVGVSVFGLEQLIRIEGNATTGSRTAPNIATLSGTCTVDMGDGTPVIPGVPFTATISTNPEDQGTIGLEIGGTTLPNAVVNAGSMVIK